jgi:hypothetical protein
MNMGKSCAFPASSARRPVPADAIYIEGAEDPRPYEERIGQDHRYAKVLPD